MRKFTLPLFFVAVVATMFTFCKKQEPTPDPNEVLAKTIATNSKYSSKAPETEWQFIFTAAEGDSLPAYMGYRKDDGPQYIKAKGTWEVKNQALFLTKTEGFDFDKVNGCRIINDGAELELKSGSTIIYLYADSIVAQ